MRTISHDDTHLLNARSFTRTSECYPLLVRKCGDKIMGSQCVVPECPTSRANVYQEEIVDHDLGCASAMSDEWLKYLRFLRLGDVGKCVGEMR